MTGPSGDDALTAPAVARNREPILAVLRRVLPPRGTVLEIASGTGEHGVHFAAGLPHLTWQPSDREPRALRSIAAHRAAADLPNLLPPIVLDAAAPDWPLARADAVVSINMIHIAPWAAAEGLMAGAERLLAPGGVLFSTARSKKTASIPPPAMRPSTQVSRRRIRNGACAISARLPIWRGHTDFDLVERVAMPANNLSVIFRKR